MNGIQGKQPTGRQWNRLLDTVFTILKYTKRKVDHSIYVKGFSEKTESYLRFSTSDVLRESLNHQW